MRTYRYRVRKGFGNKAVLQEEFSWPTLIGGHADATLRQIEWCDVPFDQLSNIRFAPLALVEVNTDRNTKT